MSAEKMTFRVPEKMANEIRNISKEKSITQIEALTIAWNNFINNEKEESNEKIADIVIAKIEEKYGNQMTRIKIGTQENDKNTQVIMELLNTIFIRENIKDVITTDTSTSQALMKARDHVKSRIANAKQKKDSEVK